MSIVVKGHGKIAEIVARCLSGVETVPKEYMGRMVSRAAREAENHHQEKVKELESKINKLEEEIDDLHRDISYRE